MAATITKAVLFEDSGACLLARILGNAGTPITQASLASISYNVFDLNGATPLTPTQTGTLTISAVIFDTLQTGDPRWTIDTTGWNFMHAAPASWFVDAGRQYRVELRFVPSVGEQFWAVFHLTTQEIFTS